MVNLLSKVTFLGILFFISNNEVKCSRDLAMLDEGNYLSDYISEAKSAHKLKSINYHKQKLAQTGNSPRFLMEH